MKKRIVLEKHELYKLLDCLPMQMVTDEDIKKERTILLFGKERKVEQVPETFDDLEELVMKKCRGFTIRHDGIENKNAIECKGFIFHDCGVVEFEIKTKTIDEDLVIFTRYVAECMEFAQMWEMIKALTGEGK